MRKILIVVDMQNDFCLESGSLYVKGATPALWNVEKLIYKDNFDRVWFTVGISNSDLEQIGARTYYDVDRVLQTLICKASPENDKLQDSLEQELGREVVHKIIKRHTASEFKRKKAPIYITREKYEND